MYLIDKDGRIDGFYFCIDMSSGVLHSQRERRGDVLQQLVEVEFLLLERYRLLVEHRHLQHLLHEEAQAFRLVVDHPTQMFQHRRRLGHSIIVEHLCSQRDTADGRLQLVGHIVDEVVLDLRIALLAEYDIDGEDEGNEQNNRKDDGWDHKRHTGEDVGAHIGEMDLHHTHLRRGVVTEEGLLVGVFLTLLAIVRTTVYLAAVGSFHTEVVRDVDAIVHQFDLDVTIEQLEVDALLQGLVAGGIEDVIDHFVEQRLLIDITVTDNLLQRFRGLGDGVLISAQDHSLGYVGWLDGEGLQFKGTIDGAVVGCHSKLMALTNGAVETIDRHGVLAEGFALRLLHVFLQITERFIHLQITRCLIEAAVHRLVELFLLHLYHLLDVGDLKNEKSQE